MKRQRSESENISERGQEMQDNDDLLSGRLPRQRDLVSSKEPTSPETPDPMQPGIDAVESWLRDQAKKPT